MAQQRGPDRGLFDLWSNFYDAPLVQRLTYRPEQDAVRVTEVGESKIARGFEALGAFGSDYSPSSGLSTGADLK